MHDQNLYEELVVAGYGGQGIILTGKLVAQTAMKNGLEVTYMPAYGAEVRGGAASCMIVIAEESIASSAVPRPDSLITMNKASFDKFIPRVKPGGLVVMNSSQIEHRPERADLEVLAVPVDDIARELGSPRCANMVALGVYLQRKNLFTVELVARCLTDVLAQRHHDLLGVNEEALRRGMDFAVPA